MLEDDANKLLREAACAAPIIPGDYKAVFKAIRKKPVTKVHKRASRQVAYPSEGTEIFPAALASIHCRRRTSHARHSTEQRQCGAHTRMWGARVCGGNLMNHTNGWHAPARGVQREP